MVTCQKKHETPLVLVYYKVYKNLNVDIVLIPNIAIIVKCFLLSNHDIQVSYTVTVKVLSKGYTELHCVCHVSDLVN